MKEQPWLSIVIPVYNAEHEITKCVDSICPDNHPDIQVILVDDGSSDESAAVCMALTSQFDNIELISQSNKGSSAARNVGLTRAKGDWIWFVDADDLISPYALDAIHRHAGSDGIEILHFSHRIVSGQSDLRWTSPKEQDSHFEAVSQAEYLAGIYCGRYPHFIWSYVFSKRFLDAIVSENQIVFDEEFSLYEDVVSMQRLLRQIDQIGVSHFEAYGYKLVESSISHKASNRTASSGLKAVREIERYEAPEECASEKIQMEIGLLFTSYRLTEYDFLGGQIRGEIRNSIIEKVKSIGCFNLRPSLRRRYFLLRFGLIDLIVLLRRCYAK